MRSVFILFFAVAALLLSPLEASGQQFTGKVAGRVVDAATQEPLPGVNVVIEGSTLGSATDANGRYDILRVPPGEHTVIFSFIGFQSTRVEEVLVRADRTTEVNVQLREELFEGDEVVVTAERPAVVRDRTSTSADYGAREIESAPVEGLRGLLALTAGVDRTADGNFSIRGGGAYEISFLVNGVEQVMSNSGVPGYSYAFEKANNSWKYDVNPLGVEQMEVISGGFSAEYGNAQSGVVKLATKEGPRDFEGEYRVEYRAPGQYHWGPYLYGPETPEWQEWGPLENWLAKRDANDFRFLNDTSDVNIRRLHALWVSNHSPEFTPTDTVYTADGDVLYLPGQRVENRLGVYDYRQLAYTRHLIGFGGPLGADPQRLRFHVSGELRNRPTRIPTVEQMQEYGNLTMTTTFQPVPAHKFRVTLMYHQYNGGLVSGADDIRWAGRPGAWKYTLDTDSPREETTFTQTLNWTYAIDAKSFFEAQLAHSFEQYRVINRPVTQRTDPWSIPPGPWDGGFRTVFSLTTFYQQDTRTRFLDGTVGYTRQVNPYWQVKTGVQLRNWHTRYSGVSSRLANVFIAGSGFGEYYDARPTYGAAYVQNKLEFEGMVANVGLRLDGYNFNMDVPTNRFNPFYPGELAQNRG
ncbi:MAG: carboxypeptidase-like regulatory domain-containing protein, partial [Bacteroidota bacterium]